MKTGYFLGLLLIIIRINEAVQSRPCSCYTIHTDGLTWLAARSTCKYHGGDLVSMETVREWQAVKTLIQERTNEFNDDWHIGLRLNTTSGNWTWVSEKPLTIDCWQPWQPRDGAPYAVMAKNYPPGTRGLFNDVRGDIFAGFICEESSNCSYNRKECPWNEEILEPKVAATRQQSGTPTPPMIRSKGVSTRESQHSAMASIINADFPTGHIHWAVAVIPLTCVIAVLLCTVGLLIWRLKRQSYKKQNGKITVSAIHYDVNTSSIARQVGREQNFQGAMNKIKMPDAEESPKYHSLQLKDSVVKNPVAYAALYKKPTNCPISRRGAMRRNEFNELDSKYPLKYNEQSSNEYAESCWTSSNETTDHVLNPNEYHILTADYGELESAVESHESDIGKPSSSDDEVSYLEVIP